MSERSKPPACPICKAPSEARFKPFCSKRCADIDLGRWFNEDYTVPAVEPPDEWDLDLPDEGTEDGGAEDGGSAEKPTGYLH